MFPVILGLILIVSLTVHDTMAIHKQKNEVLHSELQTQSQTIQQLKAENAHLRGEKTSKPHLKIDGVRVENLKSDDKAV
jgi:cell division protein FtsB